MRSTPIITCALLLIFTAVAGYFYYVQGGYQFDPDFEGYKSIYVTSVDLSDKPEILFYWIANKVNYFGGTYEVFRYIVLFANLALTGASVLVWAKIYKSQHVGFLQLGVVALALIPFVLENYFVRIRVGLVEPVITLALALLFLAAKNSSVNLAYKFISILCGLIFLLAAPFIHFQGALLLIPIAIILFVLTITGSKYTSILALLLGIALTFFVDWRSQFRFEVLYSKYHVARYVALNLMQIILVLLIMSLKKKFVRANFFDMFLMFYTGISVGITSLLFMHPVLISGEALVRFQSVFSLIALLGALYASPRLNMVWFYILFTNGVFFVNSLITPFFDVKKIFA